MSLRLKKELPHIIHSNQKCSIEGRSIHEGCHLNRNTIDYVQERPTMGLAILNLDNKKPFIQYHILTYGRSLMPMALEPNSNNGYIHCIIISKLKLL